MQILSQTGAKRPAFMMWLAGLFSLVMIALVAVPSLWPERAPFLHPLTIDTDPENMLSPDEPVRVFHNRMKATFNLHDMIVVGVVNTQNEHGVFNPESLQDIYALTEFAKDIQWQEDGKTHGVIEVDLMAPSTVDNIEQAGLGTVRFEWLMAKPPETQQEALAIRDKAMQLPLLKDTLVSGDGKALALYIPITSKDISYQAAERLRTKIATFTGDDTYHITGQPVAQDTFGVEMFKQMAISAPMAMGLIFLLMWFFFRKVSLIISPMIVAMVSVIATMGLLVATGNTVHIMSSMIPIFIMPIAVLDAVHILSDFFDRYPKYKDRYKTIDAVMEELWRPMFYTSITTAVGFGSLALTPIPPVQTFGVFVALGVIFAWLFTVVLIPAYIMLMPEESLEGFGLQHDDEGKEGSTFLSRMMARLGRFTYQHYKLVIAGTLLCAVGAYFGIQRIQINDNPVKWFTADHPIRVADKALNERFAGTYMAYLELEPSAETEDVAQYASGLAKKMRAADNAALTELAGKIDTKADSKKALLASLLDKANAGYDAASDDTWEQWDEAVLFIEREQQASDTFKNPEVLRYMSQLQDYLLKTGLVGKSNSLADVVKTVHRELLMGEEKEFRIPDSPAAVAQTLITFQNSHRPHDLWHFVTPDYRKTSLWIQLKSGDNKDMNAVITAVETFFDENPGPVALEHNWFGLTYINVIWQDKMVAGMLEAFMGSFVIVLLLMTLLFRSLWWGVLSMIPLTVTIGFIYGIIGWVGKDYDMPVAVLSSLSLGLAVDYAIHFLARSRYLYTLHHSWQATKDAVFAEPARAIARNIIVIGVGFLPLLAAPLVPYKTVGVFISSILLLAGAATLLILPAVIRPMESWLFKRERKGDNA